MSQDASHLSPKLAEKMKSLRTHFGAGTFNSGRAASVLGGNRASAAVYISMLVKAGVAYRVRSGIYSMADPTAFFAADIISSASKKVLVAPENVSPPKTTISHPRRQIVDLFEQKAEVRARKISALMGDLPRPSLKKRMAGR